MKQIKFFAVALTLLMGLTLTSCLNSDTNPIQQMQLVARYSGSLYGSYFETAFGQKLTPTDPSKLLTLTNGLYNLYFEYNTEEVTDQNNITITLLADPKKIDDKTCMQAGSQVDQGNAALAYLEYAVGYGKLVPAMFDKNTILFPVLFWSIDPKDEKAWKEELGKHRFEFTYSVDENTPNALVISVAHTLSDANLEADKKPQRKTLQYNYYALDIRDAVRQALEKNPKLSQIIIQAKCNNGQSSNQNEAYDDLKNAIDQKYTINCAEIDFKK